MIGRYLCFILSILLSILPAFADEGGKNVRRFNSEAASDASWLGSGGDPEIGRAHV